MHRVLFAPLAVLVFVPSVWAHYSMLLPDKPSVKKGEEVTFTYQWGHPFEHELFDAPLPPRTFVLAPDGTKTAIALKKVNVANGEKKVIVGHTFRFTPQQRGDYVVVVQAQPIWMEDEQEYFQDIVKVVLHVQAQKGWDQPADLEEGEREMDITPLTRPYGLQAGMVFQAEVAAIDGAAKKARQPLAKTLVETERYNSTSPKKLPPDEHITRATKTDANGVATCTLPETGWWCVAAQRDGGKMKHEGKEFLVRQRAILWVFVDESSKGDK
jgi:uncharacterized GH25 family protein